MSPVLCSLNIFDEVGDAARGRPARIHGRNRCQGGEWRGICGGYQKRQPNFHKWARPAYEQGAEEVQSAGKIMINRTGTGSFFFGRSAQIAEIRPSAPGHSNRVLVRKM